MIREIYMENYFAFKGRVELKLEADNYTKKFPDNVTKENTLKSVMIFGPNNTGKTQFIRGVETIKNIILNKENYFLTFNIFSKKNIIKMGISFHLNKKNYKYEFAIKYNKEVVYEKFSEIINNTEKVIIMKDSIKKIYQCDDSNLKKALPNTSPNNIVIYTLNTDNFPTLKMMKETLLRLANRIEVIDMNRIEDNKTIDLLKNCKNKNEKIVSFIKNADLFLEDYFYDENASLLSENIVENLNTKNENIARQLDRLKMVSVYKGERVPSLLFDSLGTQKIASLASYILEALEEGKSLFIDELDSSLHFKLTRAIISMFNTELNNSAQLICTVHDISLLDCHKLFRKDQIWFTDKDDLDCRLYTLNDFSYQKTGIRESSDIIEKYKRGLLGAIPEPDLIATLLKEDNDDV